MQQRRQQALRRDYGSSRLEQIGLNNKSRLRFRLQFFIALFIALVGLSGFLIVLAMAVNSH